MIEINESLDIFTGLDVVNKFLRWSSMEFYFIAYIMAGLNRNVLKDFCLKM